MIKRTDYDAEQARINDPAVLQVNALAAALGFTFVDGEYVKATRTYAKKTPAKTATATARPAKRILFRITEQEWDAVRNLTVGQYHDVTELMRRGRLNMEAMQKRLYQMQWGARQHGNRGTWRLVRRNGQNIVIREA
jgi:hypothetical protein